jgi:hypothetical protein
MFTKSRSLLSEAGAAYVAMEQRVMLPQKGVIVRTISPHHLTIVGNGFRQMGRLGFQKLKYWSVIWTPALIMGGVYRLIWNWCEHLEESRKWACAE